MNWDPQKPVVPMTAKGEMMSYPYGGVTWTLLEPFKSKLTLSGTIRGRSSLIFVWIGPDGRRWPMFATDVADLIKRGDIRDGKALGIWTAAKRGANYGLRLA